MSSKPFCGEAAGLLGSAKTGDCAQFKTVTGNPRGFLTVRLGSKICGKITGEKKEERKKIRQLNKKKKKGTHRVPLTKLAPPPSNGLWAVILISKDWRKHPLGAIPLPDLGADPALAGLHLVSRAQVEHVRDAQVLQLCYALIGQLGRL